MKTCGSCGFESDRVFCKACGKVLDPAVLKSVRLMGPVGVGHSTSPKIEEFWATGDAEVFSRPG